MGVSRAIRVFSKKLFGFFGALFWRILGAWVVGLDAGFWGCGGWHRGMRIGGVLGVVRVDDWGWVCGETAGVWVRGARDGG